MRTQNICSIALAFAAFAASGFAWDLKATLSAGQTLDREEPQSSLLFEPRLGINLQPTDRLEFYTSIERPTDRYLPYRAPKTIVSFGHTPYPEAPTRLSLRFALTALDLFAVGTEGYQLRPAAGVELNRELTPGLGLAVRVGPFSQINQYRQLTTGQDLPRFGFHQRASLVYHWGPWTVEGRVNLEQGYAGVWRNEFTTFEEVAYAIDRTFSVGLSHELVSQLIDDSTGYHRSLQIVDGRESRFSALLMVSL